MLECPYCHHTFSLTVFRYMKSTGGEHVCPRCLKRSWITWKGQPCESTLGATCIINVLSIGVSTLVGAFVWYQLGAAISVGIYSGIAVGLFVAVVVDYYLDQIFGILRIPAHGQPEPPPPLPDSLPYSGQPPIPDPNGPSVQSSKRQPQQRQIDERQPHQGEQQ